MNYVKQNHLSILIILFMVYSAFIGGNHSVTAGALPANVTTVSNPWFMGSTTISSLTVGQAGTRQTNSVITTCSMIANNAPTGTTSQYAYCTGVTGVVSTDLISASFASSTVRFVDSVWQITGAKASTTAGVIDFTLIGVASQAMSQVSVIGSSTVIRASH